VAPFYEESIQRVHSLHETVLKPGVLSLLSSFPRGRLLEIGCGTGYFSRILAEKGFKVVGVDISPAMIATARRLSPKGIEFVVDSGEELSRISGRFSIALSVLAVGNMEDPERVFTRVHRFLDPDAPFFLVFLHPCFRFPRQSGWGYDPQKKLIFRRMDRYLTPLEVPIQMFPGKDPGIVTITYHRPLSFYIQALSRAGFVVDWMEEWGSSRRSTSGPFARAENRARKEFPVFVAIRARAG
jgi:SAM-dependent methyltransferase